MGILTSGTFIDIITLLISPFFPKKKFPKLKKGSDLTIIIPAYNEENNIVHTIETAYNQSVQPKQVIVIDDFSTDKTYENCKELQKFHSTLKVIRQKKNKGKANNITYVLNNYNISEFTMVLDADTFLSPKFIELMIKPFADPRISIVTAKSFPIRHKNFFGKIIYQGSMFQYIFFAFRKRAQSIRNAVSVISGDSSVYRTSLLNEVGGLPRGTQTEDMDITWVALEMGHKVYFQKKALARSKDAETFKGHWKQITRWYSGGFQCAIRHNVKLFKAKSLLFTTLIPFYLDSMVYSIMLLFSWMFVFKFPYFILGFYLADFIFTVIAMLIVNWRAISYLPDAYIIKFVWSAAWLWAFVKTSFQFVFLGKRSWGGTWGREAYYKRRKKI